MKKTIYILITLLIISCSNDIKNKVEQSKIIEQNIQLDTKQKDILDLFRNIKKNSLKLTIKEDWENQSFSTTELIPIYYQNYFIKIKFFDWNHETTLMPFGKLKLNSNLFLLIVVEQYDYGVRCYGLIYDSLKDDITDNIILAKTYGDAEVSEIIWSDINFIPKFEITKHKETCIAELDYDKEPIELISENCKDSLFVTKINDNKFNKIN